MHDFSDQIERLFIVVLLLLFGGAINQELLTPLTLTDAGWGLFLLLVLRPLAGLITLIGIGAFFFIAFALQEAHFPEAERLWSIAGFVILASIPVHGVLATPIMRWLDRQHKR